MSKTQLSSNFQGVNGHFMHIMVCLPIVMEVL